MPSAWNACRTPSTRPSMRRWRWWASPRPTAKCRGSGRTSMTSSCRSPAWRGRPTRLVLRGDPAARKFAVFHLRDGAVAAVEAVNAAPEYMIGKKLIAEGKKIAAETPGRYVHSHEADGVMAPPKYKVTYIEDERQSAHRRGGRRLVADGRRGEAPDPRHRCRLRRRLRLRHLPGLCRARLGGQAAAQERHGRNHAGFRARCAAQQPAVLPVAHDAPNWTALFSICRRTSTHEQAS